MAMMKPKKREGASMAKLLTTTLTMPKKMGEGKAPTFSTTTMKTTAMKGKEEKTEESMWK